MRAGREATRTDRTSGASRTANPHGTARLLSSGGRPLGDAAKKHTFVHAHQLTTYRAASPLVQGRMGWPRVVRPTIDGKGDAMGPPNYMTVDAFCAMVYGPNWDATDKSRKSKRDTVSRMCRDGTVEARKVGRRWLIEM